MTQEERAALLASAIEVRDSALRILQQRRSDET